MNARYQDGEIGRFLSQDPAFHSVGSPKLEQKTNMELEQYLSDPQLHNSYSYVRNNPLKHVDPTGEFIETAIDVVSLSLSINDFRQNPSLSNAAWVGLDAVGSALPGIPAVAGIARHGGDVVRNGKAIGETTEQIVKFGVEYAKNLDFKMTARAWSPGRLGDNLGSLVDHFVRHGDEVGAKSVGEYYQKANSFIDNGNYARFEVGNGYELWDSKNRMLAVIGKNSQIRSYYKVERLKDIERLNKKLGN